MTAIKIYLDEDVHTFIAHTLRLRGWETLTPQEAEQREAHDVDQIAFATERGYTIVSYNVQTGKTRRSLGRGRLRGSRGTGRNYSRRSTCSSHGVARPGERLDRAEQLREEALQEPRQDRAKMIAQA